MSLLMAASETSKTSYYVLAGALAVFAVLVSLIGISRSDFPAFAQRGVMILAVVLVAGTMSAAVLTA